MGETVASRGCWLPGLQQRPRRSAWPSSVPLLLQPLPCSLKNAVMNTSWRCGWHFILHTVYRKAPSHFQLFPLLSVIPKSLHSTWCNCFFCFFFFYYLFILLCRILAVACRIFIASWGIFHWSAQTLCSGTRAPECAGSVVVTGGLSCSTACGILVPWPGIEPSSPALQSWFLTTGPPGKSLVWS